MSDYFEKGRPGDRGQKGDSGSAGVDVLSAVKVIIFESIPFPDHFHAKKPTFFIRDMQQGIKLKRSVTTLRGGTLGYAEIVAVKVLSRAAIL